MTDRHSYPLSAAGTRRRAAMLRTLQAEMKTRQRRRRTRRSAGLALGLLAVMSAGLWWRMPRPGHRPDAISVQPQSPQLSDPWSPANILVQSRPQAVAHYLVSSKDVGALQAQPVTDEELLALLDAAGHPSDLARIGGKLTILPKPQPRQSET